jgi:hypothetical protein
MELFGADLSRSDVLRRVGGLGQVGGVRLVQLEDGHGRGTRVIEFRTASGLVFDVLVDRGMDVGLADYAGIPLAWVQGKGFAAPAFYEEAAPHSWLRYGLGGLFNTAGVIVIGDHQTAPAPYNFSGRSEAFYGIHDRIAVTPADRVSYGETWEGDRCVLWAEGTMREEISYGESVSLSRRYEVDLGEARFRIRDTVRNEGFFSTPHQLLYHFNIGYPIVDAGSELLASVGEAAAGRGYGIARTASGSDEPYRVCSEPQKDWGHEAFNLTMRPDETGFASAALVNRAFRGWTGPVGVYLRYDHRMLPAWIHNQMLAEGLYSIGMEPATNWFRPVPELLEMGYPVMLEPGEERVYVVEFGVLVGADAIDAFDAALPGA